MPVDASEGWFRALVDNAPSFIWISSETGTCTYFNRAWLAYTGRTLEQELGEGWTEGVHPDDLERCMDTYRSHFANRQPFRMEYRLRRADGTYGWVLDDGVPRYAEDGAFLGYIGSCVDVTDRRQAEALMRRETVTRALARRLLTEIVSRGRVPDSVIRETGRALASEVPAGSSLAECSEVYRAMGFGQLRYAGPEGARHVFTATDLIERQASALRPTCYLTLGFLEGAVGIATARRTLGSELRCQSLGHDACRFVVIPS